MGKSQMKSLRDASARFRKENPGLYRRMAFECSVRAEMIKDSNLSPLGAKLKVINR